MTLTRRTLLIHSAALSLATMGLGGCGTVHQPTVQAKLSGRSITVISTLGTTLRLSWRGTTALNNELGQAFVSEWGFKEQLENSTIEQLKASGRFSNVQRAVLTATRREEALKELKELKTPTDYVLLISEALTSDTIWDTKLGYVGLGLAQRSVLSVGTESAAHVSLKADLLVPSTFGVVLGEATVASAQRIPASVLRSGPRLNDNRAAAARESLKVQVDAAVQSLVSQLGLGVKAAVPGAKPATPASPADPTVPAPSGEPTLPSGTSPVTSPEVERRPIPAP